MPVVIKVLNLFKPFARLVYRVNLNHDVLRDSPRKPAAPIG